MMALKVAVLCNSAAGRVGRRLEYCRGPDGGLFDCRGTPRRVSRKKLWSRGILWRGGPVRFRSQKHERGQTIPGGEGKVLFVKGAPDIILDRCASILVHGKRIPLGPEQRDGALRANGKLAGQALRVLALAWRELGRDSPVDESAENGLTFAGLIAMSDPPSRGEKID